MNTSNITIHPGMTEAYGAEDLDLIIAMVIVGILTVTGTIGNAFVIYVFVRQKPKPTSTIYILTLACADFMTSFVTMPFTIGVELSKSKVVYDIVCKLYMFLITSTVPFSAFVMVAIAVDRYLCIVHPFKHRTSMTTKKAKVIVTLLLFLAITLGLLCALMYGTYLIKRNCVKINNFTTGLHTINSTMLFTATTDQVQCNSSLESEIIHTGICGPNSVIFDTLYRKVYQKIYSAFFGVCAIVVIVLYAIIYRTVFTRRRQHFKTAVMLSIVAITFIVAFLPAWLMALLVIPPNVIIYYLYFTYNVANPVIYGFLNKYFRQQLLNLMKCKPESSISHLDVYQLPTKHLQAKLFKR